MKTKVPRDCRECDKSHTCNNPGPYGSYRCAYRPYIEEALLNAALNPNKEVNNHGNR